MMQENLRNPKTQQQAQNEQRFVQNNFAAAMRKELPLDKIPDNGLEIVENVKCYATHFEGRTGTKPWSSATFPTLVGRDDYEATKSGYLITKTAGDNFTNADLNRYFIWPSGHAEQILEVVSTTVVRVHTNTARSAATAANPASIGGEVNCVAFHKLTSRWILHIDSRVFYANYNIPSWNAVKRLCASELIDDRSGWDESGDFIFVSNYAGLFKIDMTPTIPEMVQINVAPAENTVGETAEDATNIYGRRYLYAMSILAGTGIRDRQTAGAVIKMETAPNFPDADNRYRDYAENFTAFPISDAAGTYQARVGAPVGITIVDAQAAINSNWVIRMTLGTAALNATRDVFLPVSVVSSWYQVAALIQQAMRDTFELEAPNATCQFNGATDSFVLTAGREPGTQISMFAEAVAGSGLWQNNANNTILNAYVNGATGFFNSFEVVGPFTQPVGEQQFTHYSLKATPDTGSEAEVTSGQRSSNPNLDRFIWHSDIAVCKAFTASVNAAGNICTATEGEFQREDVGNNLTFNDGSTFYISGYTNAFIVTGTSSTGVAIASQGCQLGASRVFTLSQTNYVVTRTDGDVFVAGDVEKTIHLANGSYVRIRSFVNANSVLAYDDENHAAQGAAIDPTSRYISDWVADATLLNRESAYALENRYMDALPSISGLIKKTPGFIFVAPRGGKTISYGQIGYGLDYQMGYYNPRFQYENLDDVIVALRKLPDILVILCSTKTRRIPVNISKSVPIPGTDAIVSVVTGITDVDEDIGCVDEGSIGEFGESALIFITNEPGLRVFDGYRYGPNMLIDQQTRDWMIRDDFRNLQSAVSAFYDADEGYVVFGTNTILT